MTGDEDDGFCSILDGYEFVWSRFAYEGACERKHWIHKRDGSKLRPTQGKWQLGARQDNRDGSASNQVGGHRGDCIDRAFARRRRSLEPPAPIVYGGMQKSLARFRNIDRLETCILKQLIIYSAAPRARRGQHTDLRT